MGKRLAFHTCTSQGCITGWLQTANSPGHVSLLTMMWHSRSWLKDRSQLISVSRNDAPVLQLLASNIPQGSDTDIPEAQAPSMPICGCAVRTEKRPDPRGILSLVPGTKAEKTSTSLHSLKFCHSLLYQILPPAPSTYCGALRKCYQITRNTSSQLAIYNKNIL